jgi:Flp pilus assembly protein TadD
MDVQELLSWEEALHKGGHLARAEDVYRDVVRWEPSEARAWFLLGVVFQATGRAEDAIPVLRRSLELRPEHAACWNVLGVSLAQLGRPAEAATCFEQALRIQPDHAEAAGNLALARRDRDAPGRAFSAPARPAAPDQTFGVLPKGTGILRKGGI